MNRYMRYVKDIKGRFDWARVVTEARADALDMCELNEDNDALVGHVYLGSWTALSPSGKHYQPFACSNVAGDCPTCKGAGAVTNHKANASVYKRASRDRAALTRENVVPGRLFTDWSEKARHRAHVLDDRMLRNAPTLTCPVCRGLGSVSAARDEDWTRALEHVAEKHGLYVDMESGDVRVGAAYPLREVTVDGWGLRPGIKLRFEAHERSVLTSMPAGADTLALYVYDVEGAPLVTVKGLRPRALHTASQMFVLSQALEAAANGDGEVTYGTREAVIELATKVGDVRTWIAP